MFDQTYPYTDATFTGIARQAHSAATTGGHVGADLAFYFSDMIGLGGTVRVSRGSVNLSTPDGRTRAITTGGVQTSGGLRLRF